MHCIVDLLGKLLLLLLVHQWLLAHTCQACQHKAKAGVDVPIASMVEDWFVNNGSRGGIHCWQWCTWH